MGNARGAQGFLQKINEGATTRKRETEQSRRRSFQKLFFWLNRHGFKIDGDHLKYRLVQLPELTPGAEHSVWLDIDSRRVIKLLHPDAVELGVNPQTYITNLLRGNSVFNDDRILEGYADLGDGNQLISSQTYVDGPYATAKEIQSFFQEGGFRMDSSTGGWVNGDNTTIIDAGSRNMITSTTAHGSKRVFPIDVHIELPEGAEDPFTGNQFAIGQSVQFRYNRNHERRESTQSKQSKTLWPTREDRINSAKGLTPEQLTESWERNRAAAEALKMTGNGRPMGTPQ